MASFVKVQSDTSLKISVESELLQAIRKAHTWYTSHKFTTPAAAVLALIDFFGFLQIANMTLPDSVVNRGLIIAAFIVAFEVSTMYVGYALSLKSYNLGKPVHNIVFWLSSIAFAFGVIGNIIYRIYTMGISYKETPDLALPITILLILLPIITSLMNVVVGCLAFDPLLFDLYRLSKKLSTLRIRKSQLEGYITALSNEDELKETLNENETLCYNNTKIEISAMRMRLRNYVAARTSTAYDE